MNGEIVHVEFPSADFEKSSAFYEALFGWHPDSEQAGGHLGLRVPGGVQSSWVRSALAYASAPVVFVAVANLAATLAEVKRLGGRVLVAEMRLPGKGKGEAKGEGKSEGRGDGRGEGLFALLADPDGNVLAVTSAAGSASVAAGGASGPVADVAPAVPSIKGPKTPPAAKPSTEAIPKPKAKSKVKR